VLSLLLDEWCSSAQADAVGKRCNELKKTFSKSFGELQQINIINGSNFFIILTKRL
jgi:hypothetical protein